jgi:hypothetical protein
LDEFFHLNFINTEWLLHLPHRACLPGPLSIKPQGAKLMAKISRIDALVNVVEYLIDDERDDYLGNPARSHIYRSILVLEKWIKEGVMTEEH